MNDRRPARTAEQRLAERKRDIARLRRSRLEREIAGPRWYRMRRLVPVLFSREGTVASHHLVGTREDVIDALRGDVVFAVDTAMRLVHGFGFLSGGDIHAYATCHAPIDRLVAADLVECEPTGDTVLVRPWPGPARLLLCVVDELPPHRWIRNRYRVVDAERSRRELVGSAGARADLFALLERAESDALDRDAQ